MLKLCWSTMCPIFRLVHLEFSPVEGDTSTSDSVSEDARIHTIYVSML